MSEEHGKGRSMPSPQESTWAHPHPVPSAFAELQEQVSYSQTGPMSLLDSAYSFHANKI